MYDGGDDMLPVLEAGQDRVHDISPTMHKLRVLWGYHPRKTRQETWLPASVVRSSPVTVRCR